MLAHRINLLFPSKKYGHELMIALASCVRNSSTGMSVIPNPSINGQMDVAGSIAHHRVLLVSGQKVLMNNSNLLEEECYVLLRGEEWEVKKKRSRWRRGTCPYPAFNAKCFLIVNA